MARIIKNVAALCKRSSKTIVESIVDVTCFTIACASLIAWLQLN